MSKRASGRLGRRGCRSNRFFNPVLTLDNAEKIARDWNSTQPAPGKVDYVTRFKIDAETASHYPVENAGGKEHQELWVPADELNAFNEGIVGKIEVVATYRDGARITDTSESTP